MSGSVKGFSLGLVVGLLGVALSVTPLGLELEEDLGLWWLFKVRGPRPAPPEVVVVAIDRQAADNLSLPRNPREWPRTLHAQLTDRLAQAGAAVIVFDLIFDRDSDDTGHDAAFAAALHRARNVVLVDRLSRDDRQVVTGESAVVGHFSLEEQIPPISILADSAAAHAPFPLPKATRVNGYWSFKSGAGDYPTIPVVAFQVYALRMYPELINLLRSADPKGTEAWAEGGANAAAAERSLPERMMRLRDTLSSDPDLPARLFRELCGSGAEQVTPSEMQTIASLLELYSGDETRYLSFYGPPRSIRTMRYDEALKVAGAPTARGEGSNGFEGKAIFVGFSAASQPEQDRIRDDYHTVFSESNALHLSGVEIAATAFANLLEGRTVRPIDMHKGLAILFLWGVTAGAIGRFLRVTSAASLTFALVGVYLIVAQYRFESDNVWLPLVIPLCIQAPTALLGSLLLQYRVARRERDVIRQLFGQFLPRPVVDKLAKHVGPITSLNQVVFGACLATDAEHYTTLSEQMDPRRLSALLNEYYAALFEPVERRGGTVSDVVGDAMLAIWASSAAEASQRRSACHAALEIAATLEQFNQSGERPPLPTRIGLHSGQMLLGSIGAAGHYEYRAVGDIVNTATRIEGLGKHLGVRLTVSEEMLEGLDEFLARPLGRFVLAGKSTPVHVYELLCLKDEARDEQIWLCGQFKAALDAYSNQQWRAAAEAFSLILEVMPGDGPAAFYLTRSERFAANPPEQSWDCSVHMVSK